MTFNFAVTEDMYLGQGRDGIVYGISHHIAVKFFRQSRKMRREKTINEELRGVGVHVPWIYGIITAKFPANHKLHNYGHRQWGLVMERLLGFTEDIPSEFLPKALESYTTQMEKILDRGYNPLETKLGKGTFYDPQKRRVYFFDFSRWRREELPFAAKKELLDHPHRLPPTRTYPLFS